MEKTAQEVAKLDAQADELLSMMMNGESPETNERHDDNNFGQIEQSQDANVTDSLETKEVEHVQTEVKSDELETLKKRLVDSQRKITELGQENASLRNQLADANRQIAEYREKEFTSKQTDRHSSIEALADEYEFIKPLLDELNELRTQVRQHAQQSMQVKQEIDLQAAQQAHMNAILMAHPDAFSVAESQEFNQWLANQHPRLQRVVQDGTADEVIQLLHQFKSQVNKQQQASKLDQAREMATPNTRSQTLPNAKRTYTRAEIKAMPMSEYLRLEDDIDAAFAEWRVI